jgi:ABC-2 type transport system ATP-binding protein
VANSTETDHEKVAVVISTPYMDEAARCHRIGFMRKGRLIAEGHPSEIRALLNGQVVELRGDPLPKMRELASSVEGVEDVHAFGDRLHLRVHKEQADAVVRRLKTDLPVAGVTLIEVRAVPPVLEDVFIALSRQSE